MSRLPAPDWKADNCKEELINEIIEKDYIRNAVPSSDVWKSNPKWQKYPYRNFASNFKRYVKDIKNKSSYNMKSNHVSDDLHSQFESEFIFDY